jgi:hypothetical protein
VQILVALVPVGGLIWGAVTYFVPKPEPPKTEPSKSVAASAPASIPPVGSSVPKPLPNVTASGHGSIAVGTMTGGSITGGGNTTAAPSPTASARP